jgi:hypothetical protein
MHDVHRCKINARKALFFRHLGRENLASLLSAAAQHRGACSRSAPHQETMGSRALALLRLVRSFHRRHYNLYFLNIQPSNTGEAVGWQVLWGLCLRVLAERCLSGRRPARHPTKLASPPLPNTYPHLIHIMKPASAETLRFRIRSRRV